MKTVIAFAALILPTAAEAQTIFESTLLSSPYSPQAQSFGPITDTPTMRREKARQAMTLRTQAAGFLAEDGGTLTPQHQAYVQRRAREILGRHG